MARKTWIKVRRGLIDPKHKVAMGNRIWLYLYMLDRADWSTGEIHKWRDRDAEDDMGIPRRTVQDQRQDLVKAGYISCRQSHQSIVIKINKWSDPRPSEKEVVKTVGTEISVPTEIYDEFFMPIGTGHPNTDPYTDIVPPSFKTKEQMLNNNNLTLDNIPDEVLWQSILDGIRATYFPTQCWGDNYAKYFAPTSILSFEDDLLTVLCDGKEHCDWLAGRGKRKI